MKLTIISQENAGLLLFVPPVEESIRAPRLREPTREGWGWASSVNLEPSNQRVRDTSTLTAANEKEIRGESEKVINRVELQGFHEGLISINPD